MPPLPLHPAPDQHRGTERRRHARTPAALPAKLRREATRHYYAGTLCNHNPTGALLRLDMPVRFKPGEHVAFAVAGGGQNVLLSDEGLEEAVVLRGAVLDGHAHVALRFLEAAPLALSA